MNDDEADDRPWTEEQWERFMQRCDARTARLGELLETLRDDPDHERIIAREMGWDHLLEMLDARQAAAEGSSPEEEPLVADFESAAGGEFDGDDDGEFNGDDEEAELDDWEDEDVDSIPAYTAGCDWSFHVHQALERLFPADDEEPDEDLLHASAASLVAAKLAGGHGMGYADDVLCGNIVCCKRALAAADEALAGLAALRARQLGDAARLDAVLTEGRQVRQLVEAWISELRSRVWWA